MYEPIELTEQEAILVEAMLYEMDYKRLAQQIYDSVHQFDYALTDTMIGFVEDVAKLLQSRVCRALNATEESITSSIALTPAQWSTVHDILCDKLDELCGGEAYDEVQAIVAEISK